MATTNKDLNLPALGSTSWNVPLNENFDFIDASLGGLTTKVATGVGTTPVILTAAEYRNLSVAITGTLTANVTYRVPAAIGGQWIVRNGTTGSFTVTFGISGGGTSVVIPQGTTRTVYSDGTNVRLSDDVLGGIPNTYVVYSNGTSFAGSPNLTYDGLQVNVTRDNSSGTSTVPVLSLHRSTSATAAANIGASLAFYTENAAGTDTYGAAVAGVLESATIGAENYKLQFRIMAAGATPASVAEITTTGITYGGNLTLTARAATNTAVQPLAYAGFTTTADNDGTIASGTYLPTPVGGNMKRIINGGAFTISAPTEAGDYTMVIQITNAGSGAAGVITLSGFTKTSGSLFTTTGGHDFFLYITKCNGFTLANTVALQ
jgi:hypothetical protein